MIDAGVNGICILANYSEQFTLTDDELVRLLTVDAAQYREEALDLAGEAEKRGRIGLQKLKAHLFYHPLLFIKVFWRKRIRSNAFFN